MASSIEDIMIKVLPLPVLAFGIMFTFFGRRMRRLFALMLGLFVGGLIVHVLIPMTGSTTGSVGVMVIVSIMATMTCGVLAVLIRQVASGIAFGSLLGLLGAMSLYPLHPTWLPNYAVIGVTLVFIVIVVVAGIGQPTVISVLSSYTVGGLLVVVSVDFYVNALFAKFIWNIVSSGIHVDCDLPDGFLIPRLWSWVLISLAGISIQFLALKSAKTHSSKQSLPVYKADKMFIKRSTSMANLDGVGTPRAAFNYFSPIALPDTLKSKQLRLTAVFTEVSMWFGFQDDNRDNQKEHVMFLLSNLESQGHVDSVLELHTRIFENYRYWCSRIRVRPAVLWDKPSNHTPALWDIALYMCIWGEASNLRHCPELLCYLFHQTSSECQGSSIKPAHTTPQGTFLAAVVRPIYDIVVSQSKGDHTSRLNYDDVNEFFWNKKCTKYHYAVWNLQNRYSTKHSFENVPCIIQGLQEAKKTYVEHRSWLHPFKSFNRVLTFLLVSFHLLTCIAFLENMTSSWNDPVVVKVLGSVLLTMTFLDLVSELLHNWNSTGQELPSTPQLVAGCFRLFLKASIFIALTVYYLWSLTSEFGEELADRSWATFETIGIAYLIPWTMLVLLQLVPTIGQAIWSFGPIRSLQSIWTPAHDMYLDFNMTEPEQDCFTYQIFWVTLLSCKMACSYLFQIRPLVLPTTQLLLDPAHRNILFPHSHILLLISLWFPFICIFFIDLSVWYSVWSAAVGALVGISEKLGEIRHFTMIKKRFMALAGEFEKKLLFRDSHVVSIRVDPAQPNKIKSPNRFLSMLRKRVADPDLNEPLLGSSNDVNMDELKDSRDATPIGGPARGDSTSPLFTEQWQKFSMAWADMVDNMRARDLISNSERDTLRFRIQDHCLRLPLFLCAGTLESVLEFAISLDAKRRLDGTGTKTEYEVALLHRVAVDECARDAIAQIWASIKWLLTHLLGDRHEAELEFLISEIGTACLRKNLLEFYDIRKIMQLKDALLDVIRLLLVACKQRNARRSSATDSSADTGASLLPKLGVQTMRKDQSSGTLSMLAKVAKQAPLPQGEVRVVRLQVRALLDVLKQCCQRSTVISKINKIVSDGDGFFHEDDYTLEVLSNLLVETKCHSELTALHAMLTMTSFDAKPKSIEARRRLMRFVNSLFMDMPEVRSVRAMHSWSVMTPFYSEDVIYSRGELLKETEGGVSPMLYLRTIFPDEWANFCERIGVDALEVDVLDTDKGLQAQIWATHRGQTLFRTVSGMMLHDGALRLLSKLEEPTISFRDQSELALQKFTYIVTCQRYGMQKRTGDCRASDIEYMLGLYPNLRVAYIDTVQVPIKDSEHGNVEIEEHFSVLIKSVKTKDGVDMIQEVFRIKLPGNPIVGEGKPENQNHAMIFTRGQMVQCIDMNQDAYFEEALKMRNILQEFEGGSEKRPITIVGFSEHIFTSRLSSIASYMALQEGVFVTLGQRVLANPLKIRMHYGHPDVFNKIFAMTRGGVSKASRGINLSEDIFAGFNTTLRGGNVVFKEYMEVGKGRDVGLQQLTTFEAKLSQGAAEQTFSRDVSRLAVKLDFFRLMSFYTGGLGFYYNNSLTIFAVFMLAYAKLLWTLFGFSFVDKFAGVTSGAYWFGMIGFLTTLPILATLGVVHGFRTASFMTLKMLFTGGPLFFCFAMATKAHYFERTILAGGAKYRPTGRGFVTKHENFAEIFRFHADSHFGKALELFLVLILYKHYTQVPEIFWSSTWPMWLLVLSWSFAPFWFNPMAFDLEKTHEDASEFLEWMWRSSSAHGKSWKRWFDEENGYLDTLGWASRLVLCAGQCRFLLIGLGILMITRTSVLALFIAISGITLPNLIFLAFRKSRYATSQLTGRFINALLTLIIMVVPVVVVISLHIHWDFVVEALQTFIGVLFITTAILNSLTIAGLSWHFVGSVYRLYHLVLGAALLAPVAILAALVVPSWLQTKMTFYSAFDKGTLVSELLRGNRSRQRQHQALDSMAQIRQTLELQQKQLAELTRTGRTPSPAPVSTAIALDTVEAAKKPDTRPIPKTVSGISI